MLFEIEKTILRDALNKCVPISNNKSTLPILSHVLMHTREDGLVLTATDLEIGVQILCRDWTCNDPGTACVPGKKFLEIVRELPSGLITAELTDSSRLKLTAGSSVFELATQPADDYPAWSNFEGVQFAEVSAIALEYMIELCDYAVSTSDARFNLNGMLMDPLEGSVRFVATDGHRLAYAEHALNLGIDRKRVLPFKGVQEIKKHLSTCKDNALVQVGFDDKNCVVKSNGSILSARLVDGDYPDYRKVIPARESITEITANRLNLLQSVKRVSVVVSDKAPSVNFWIQANNINVSCTHPDLGSAKDQIGADYSGEDLNFVLNGHYLVEALNVMESEDVTIEWIKEGAPIFLKPGDTTEEWKKEFGQLHLIMPMRK